MGASCIRPSCVEEQHGITMIDHAYAVGNKDIGLLLEERIRSMQERRIKQQTAACAVLEALMGRCFHRWRMT